MGNDDVHLEAQLECLVDLIGDVSSRPEQRERVGNFLTQITHQISGFDEVSRVMEVRDTSLEPPDSAAQSHRSPAVSNKVGEYS